MNLINWQDSFAIRAQRIGASEIRELLGILDQPGMISFAGGIPDPELFPLELVKQAYRRILEDPSNGVRALQYSTSEGYPPLREEIAGYMDTLHIKCSSDNIIITNGSQQALDFLGKLLLSPLDTALVTAPTYLGALQAFNCYEPRYDFIGDTSAGRTARSYRDIANATGGRVRFAYVVPDFANPTGETMDRGDRLSLLELAEELGVPLIEDAAYTELRYDGDRLDPLLALDIARCGSIDKSRTIYCGTFSKTYAPALRVGWICASRELIRKLVLIKQGADLNSSLINQMIMHSLLESGVPERVGKICLVYRHRRDRMLSALEAGMPPGAFWRKPDGGMFVWMTLPDGLNCASLLRSSIQKARVAFVPGNAFFADGSGNNSVRLSFSLATDAEIDDGICRLGGLVKAMMGRKS